MKSKSLGVFPLFVLQLVSAVPFWDGLLRQWPLFVPNHRLISEDTEVYAKSLLKRWNSPGLSVAVVRKDDSEPTGWKQEFGSYGIARADGTPITPDSVFSIASNSKLFLAISVGLLIHNKTLAEERGKELKWTTKIGDVIPEWGLMDAEASRGATLQDLLSHRTGMPRHDGALAYQDGGVPEMISNLRYLRPSATFRETHQYNNKMYQTLSHLPVVLLNQSYDSYLAQHLFSPLNMTSSTVSIATAEKNENLADGFGMDMADLTRGKNGTLKPTVPLSPRPGEESIFQGAGDVHSSARDLATWVSMLLNNGRHPYTNEIVVPQEVIEHVATGRSVSNGGAPDYPEISPKVYGAGQTRYSYQGRQIIEHGGANTGFRTQVARFPYDNLAIVSLSNDESGNWLMEAVKWRIADEVLGLKKLDWNGRYEERYRNYLREVQKTIPRPGNSTLPDASLATLATSTFAHPAYGQLRPCLIPESISSISKLPHTALHNTHAHCNAYLSSPPIRRLLADTDLTRPTLVIPFDRVATTHLLISQGSDESWSLNVETRCRAIYREVTDSMLPRKAQQ
jgi:CubicO group peptidase (beta-lactamase class C family)